uniref:Uncharacterized protein n=1 Tax=Opuntia streptacantha TaxID=393608 RepID=A0A7C9A6S5_OPUST
MLPYKRWTVLKYAFPNVLKRAALSSQEGYITNKIVINRRERVPSGCLEDSHHILITTHNFPQSFNSRMDSRIQAIPQNYRMGENKVNKIRNRSAQSKKITHLGFQVCFDFTC